MINKGKVEHSCNHLTIKTNFYSYTERIFFRNNIP